MGHADRGLVSSEFFVRLEASVRDCWAACKVPVLCALVLINDSLLLVIVEHEQLLFFGSAKVLVGLSSVLDLLLENRKQRVIFVLHDSLTETGKGGLEELILDHGAFGGVRKLLLDLGEGLTANVTDQTLKVGLLVSLNRVEHVLGTALHVGFEVETRVSQEVDESSLLDEIVFVVDANVLDLLLGGSHPGHLDFLSVISPLGDELLGLVTRVGVVEVGELGANKEGEVTHLRDSQVEGNDVLVVEDHTSEPLVVGPGAHARERGDRANVQEKEDKTTAGSAKGLVVRGDLLRADSLEQSLHVEVVREADRVLGRVVGMFVALAH